MKNLEDIKVGDIIVVSNKHGGQFEVVNKVEKMLLVGADRKMLCYLNGLEYGSDNVDYNQIRKATNEEVSKYYEGLLKDKIANSLKCFNWRKLPSSKLEKIYELINK